MPMSPRPQSSARAAPIESNRVALRSLLEWSGIKTCRPNLTSIVQHGAGVDGSRQQRAGRLCGVPKDGHNRGPGAQAAAPHERTCAPAWTAEIRLSSDRHPKQPVCLKNTESAESTTESGLLGPRMGPVARMLGMALLDHQRAHGLLRAS